MANQIQATVVNVGGNPQSASFTQSFLTRNIIIQAETLQSSPNAVTKITYFSGEHNKQTYYVTETVTSLVTAANVGRAEQILVTVYKINGYSQRSPILFGFPASGVVLKTVSDGSINCIVSFNGIDYGVSETKSAIMTAANVDSGGGGSSTLSTLVYDNGQTGASAERTAAARLKEELWVEDFRTATDTDADVWEKAIAAHQLAAMPLNANKRTYNFNRTIIVGGGYWNIKGVNQNGTGTVINCTIPSLGKIQSSIANDLTYPTTSNPGPLSGCAFYFISLIYLPRTEGITFNGFRFGCSFLDTHNTHVFKNCTGANCNSLTFWYQGCQNPAYIGCNLQSSNTLHISSATCFASDSPYKNSDNYYTDGLVFENNDTYGAGNASVNAFFDTWFAASIFRASTGTNSTGHSNEQYNNFGETDVTHQYPSGRFIYVPMRNYRIIFNPVFRNLDARGYSPRGIALLNYQVLGLQITGPSNFENTMNAGADTTDTPYYTFGSIVGGTIATTYLPYLNGEVTHKFYKCTGRGASGIFADYGENNLSHSGRNGGLFPTGLPQAKVIGLANPARNTGAGFFEPLFKSATAFGTKTNTFAIAGGGGLVSSSAGVNATGIMTLPKVVDFTKPFRYGVMFEYVSGNGVAKVAIQSSANNRSGVAVYCHNTGGMSVDTGQLSLHNSINQNLASFQRFWLSIVGDGTNVYILLGQDYKRFGTRDSTVFNGDTNCDYWRTFPIAFTEGGNPVFDSWDQIKFENSSSTIKIMSVYFSQENKFFGPDNGKMGVPAVMNPTVSGDATAFIRLPKNYDGLNPIDLVLYNHPNASTGTRAQETTCSPNLGYAMADVATQYIIASCLGTDDATNAYTSAEASNWGAPGGLKFRYDLIQWCLTNLPGIRNIYVIGESMGCLNALALIRQYPGLIKAIVGISGVTNLTYSYNSEGFNTTINTAYGVGAVTTVQDMDPNLRPTLYKDIPIKLWHGTADGLISKAQHADLFKTNVEAVGGQVTVVPVAGAGHMDNNGLYDGPAIREFFSNNI